MKQEHHLLFICIYIHFTYFYLLFLEPEGFDENRSEIIFSFKEGIYLLTPTSLWLTSSSGMRTDIYGYFGYGASISGCLSWRTTLMEWTGVEW